FSHGTHAEHAEVIRAIRAGEASWGRPITILQDLQGPKVRLGTFVGGQAMLTPGEHFVLTGRTVKGTASRSSLNHPEFLAALRPGDAVWMDDGMIQLVVEKVEDGEVECQVVSGGPVSDHKGVSFPRLPVPVSCLAEKDREDLRFGIEQAVDYVAISFVRSAADIQEVRKFLHDQGANIPIVAKLERAEIVANLGGILTLVDAVMVARGDLGVEMPLEKVPGIQKQITRMARRAGKPVVVATQMLESMRFSPAPTRAEVTDVANAVAEGADAVMLSAETASGEYPLEAVQMMSKIIRQVENGPDYQAQLDVSRPKAEATVSDAISCAIRRISNVLPVAVLVNYSESGTSSLRAARERPTVPILNLTPNLQTARRLTVAWGVHSVVNDRLRQGGEVCSTALEIAQAQGMAQRGDTLLITAGVPFGQPGSTNSLRIEILI
ncbi:MAG TPA: pyruvate kinase, partial [Pseudomonas sp.]|nr:pyruvate kinase [Pseudomonas sp.]